MIDTDDLDRTLRAAFAVAREHDLVATDPAPRVARRVVRRRNRRNATRAGAVLVVAAIAAATIGALSSSKSKPAHVGPPPTPSVLLTPQTPADRAGIAANARLSSSALPSSIRLLQTSTGVRLFGARDRTGMPCVILVVPEHGGPSIDSGCSSEALAPNEMQIGAERFERQGTGAAITSLGTKAVAFFVPDAITTVVLRGVAYPVTRNSVLVVGTNAEDFSSPEVRHGSTLYVSK